MKVIYLDMDGVLNSEYEIRKWISEKEKHISKESVERLYEIEFKHGLELIFKPHVDQLVRILNDTGANIVWSTTWRCFYPYKRNVANAAKMLTRHGIPGDRLIGYTPDLWIRCYRGEEINEHMKKHPEITKAAIIDDGSDAGIGVDGNAKLFLTAFETGLTKEIADDVIKYLNEE